jgi:glycosyltransferase involved in cell wall biosynthesis
MVCADAPNTRALMRDGYNGRLCPDQPAAYAQALGDLLAHPAQRLELAAQALERSALYRWTEILDDVVAVYAEALGTRRPVPAQRAFAAPQGATVDPQAASLPAL